MRTHIVSAITIVATTKATIVVPATTIITKVTAVTNHRQDLLRPQVTTKTHQTQNQRSRVILTRCYQHRPHYFTPQNHQKPHYYQCGINFTIIITTTLRLQPTTANDTTQTIATTTLIGHSTKEYATMRPIKGPTIATHMYITSNYCIMSVAHQTMSVHCYKIWV